MFSDLNHFSYRNIYTNLLRPRTASRKLLSRPQIVSAFLLALLIPASAHIRHEVEGAAPRGCWYVNKTASHLACQNRTTARLVLPPSVNRVELIRVVADTTAPFDAVFVHHLRWTHSNPPTSLPH
ncbi:unnamed protein product [Callosobruchus maculatus]|uniref:Uncharacterized protein n=1 Tax=Callosobruchus maculatus TaxID=64391 RepID=A0A653BJV8_CALMS|nr:unnamed protein product [Callosobruchus maculatus]